jgi:cytochrome bd ubiquinol oxidase subunit I
LWPELMRRFGEVIGPLFALEGFAFFTEAIFLGIYLYGRERVSPRVHFASGVVVAISGAASAAFVTVVNAFMNEPVTVLFDGDRAWLESPLHVFLAPSAPTQVVHTLFASYAVTAFAVSAVHAALLLRARDVDLHRAALRIVLPLACAMGLLMPLSGDASAKHVAEHQPWKTGAMEAHFETRRCAPLLIGGVPDESKKEVSFAIAIPCGLSILGGGAPDAEIRGLDRVPPDAWPPVMRTHLAFQTMVGAGSALALLSIVLLVWRLRKKAWPEHPLILRALVVAGVLAPIAMEAGWLVTESGRQPYVVRGLLTTADAATRHQGLAMRFGLFGLLYVALGIVVAILLLGLFREPETVHGT